MSCVVSSRAAAYGAVGHLDGHHDVVVSIRPMMIVTTASGTNDCHTIKMRISLLPSTSSFPSKTRKHPVWALTNRWRDLKKIQVFFI